MPLSRHLRFLAALALAIVIWWRPVRSLVYLALNQDDYSYLLLVILISVALLCFERWAPPAEPKWSLTAASLLLGTVAAGLWLNRQIVVGLADLRLSLSMLLLLVLVLTLFVQIYGWDLAVRMRFPLLFLFLAVPLPKPATGWLVVALQHGSADAAYALFRLFHVPVVREGLLFSFSKIEIEVAQECSGIRSSTILAITTLVLAQLFLKSSANRALVVLWALLVGVVKNGFRIFTLSLLGEYVSTSILDGPLHHQGGPVFFFLGLVLVVVPIWLLRKKEALRRSVPLSSQAPARVAR